MLFRVNSTEQRQLNHGKGKTPKVTSRNLHRKTLRVASKPGKRNPPGKKISFGKNQKNLQTSKNIYPPTSTSLCDNSNDSGLGFDESHHLHPNHHQTTLALTTNASLAANNNNLNYHRTLSKVRYSDVIQTTTPCTTVTKAPVCEVKPISIGKKVKSTKPSTSGGSMVKVNKTLADEDTCNSDDFSSFYQMNVVGRDISKLEDVSSDNSYQTSPIGKSVSPLSDSSSSIPSTLSGTDGSSPSSIDNLDSISSFSLHNQFSNISKDGLAQLVIIQQPEQQHRARYQTEGSRGAVKDRSGNGFPIVKLIGYQKPTTLQVFIGNDVGRVSPHIFYQACKVSGKNSTPCQETKSEGTILIEIEMKPENEMTVICDCVGILKERNVDVEHRLGRNHTLAASVTRNKKKSTKCRIIFRAKINEDSDYPEILQICSNTITCTQPPGVPEICKKSLDSCSVTGGKELFIIGKNFLKDTKVSFVRYDESRPPKKLWEETVQPDKEYLQQTHLICVVPPFPNGESIHDPIQIQVFVSSSNKKSEPHNFAYLPTTKTHSLPSSPVSSTNMIFPNSQDPPLSPQQRNQYQNVLTIGGWNEQQVSSTENIMSPPIVMSRKSSFSKNLSDATSSNIVETTLNLKTEFIDQTQLATEIVVSPSDASTSNQTVLQSTSVYGNDVCGYVTQDTQALMATSQVQEIIDGFKMPNADTTVDLHCIKNEQNTETQTNMFPPPPPPPAAQELNPAQQQQVVESFLNMIVQSSVMNEPNQLTQDHIILNQSSSISPTTNVSIQSEPLLAMNSASAISPSIMCEQNIIAGVDINTLDPSAASTIVSNAVSDATAETQAVMKQMIAQAAAEILSESPAETTNTINTFISNILPPAAEPQQMQVILAQELSAVTTSLSLQETVKKEENNSKPTNDQQNLINTAPSSSASIAQPFSPTTQDLTTMSESDLISFINPSVFM